MIHLFIKFFYQMKESLSLLTRTCDHTNKWDLAVQDEIKALHENSKWDLVELPKGKKVIPNKWVYKVKTLEGKPKYKAHLVAKRYKQIQGIIFPGK